MRSTPPLIVGFGDCSELEFLLQHLRTRSDLESLGAWYVASMLIMGITKFTMGLIGLICKTF